MRGLLMATAAAGVAGHGHLHGSHRRAEARIPFNCGTRQIQGEEEAKAYALPEHHKDAVDHIFAGGGGRRLADDANGAVLTFPKMVFHVIREGSAQTSSGYLTDSQLQDQFDTLNAAFGPYIQFTAWERRDHIDAQVFSDGCNQQENPTLMTGFMDSQADTSALNTYFVDCLSYQLYGYAYFPTEWGGEDSERHGVVMDYRTIDDGDACDGGCEGDTGVHEWGHAFGLFHTFQSQVEEPACDCTWGDLVEDTPPEAGPAYGSGSGNGGCGSLADRNTCVTGEGDENDPVRNFMDYSDDRCLSEFTQGQFYRMLYILASTKPNMLSASLVGADENAVGLASNCIPGLYYDGQSCVACPDHTYNDVVGATNCTACPDDARNQLLSGSRKGLIPNLRTHVNHCYAVPADASCVYSYMGDGYCDAGNNNEVCSYDGGDCCENCCTVPEGSDYECGNGDTGHTNYQSCRDPLCADSVVPDRTAVDYSAYPKVCISFIAGRAHWGGGDDEEMFVISISAGAALLFLGGCLAGLWIFCTRKKPQAPGVEINGPPVQMTTVRPQQAAPPAYGPRM